MIGHHNVTRASALFFLMTALGPAGCGEHGGGEPNPPSSLAVMELDRGAHLTWKDNSDDEGGFMLERKIGTGNFEIYKSLDFNTTQYHDGPLTAGMSYTYRVMAMPKSGGGHTAATKYSNEVTFMLGS
jgi:hypothetical protein